MKIFNLSLFFFLIIACHDKPEKDIVVDNTTSENGTPEAAVPEISSESTSNGALAEFSIEQDTYDFGSVKQGDIVNHDFVFTNTGKAPLIISDATGSCGCTVAEYPKEPLNVGQTSKVSTVFNTANKMGFQTKTVTLYMNTEKKLKILKLVGTVK